MAFPRLSESDIRRAVVRHNACTEYDLYIADGNDRRTRVCHVVAAKSFAHVCIAAFRAYKATLQRLEIPGWSLTNGSQRIDCATLQRALVRNVGVPEIERTMARERLGLGAR